MASKPVKKALDRAPVVSWVEAENNIDLYDRLMRRSPLTTPHAPSPEKQNVDQQWYITGTACGLPTPDGLSWEADVPVAAQMLVLTVQNEPGRVVITELYGIAQAGYRHFVQAISGDGKPLYGAFVMSPKSQPCLLQLFEFVQTEINTGVFQPIPTVGGLIQGAYRLEYARLRIPGTIASLPPLLRWPPCMSSAGITIMPWLPPFVESSPGQVTAIHPVPPADDQQPHTGEDPNTSQQSLASEGGTPVEIKPGTTTAAPSQLQDDAEGGQAPVSDLRAPTATNLTHVAPETAAAHSVKVRGGAEAIAPASPKTYLSAPVEHEPLHKRCYAWSMCSTCDQFWGLPTLSEEHFSNAMFQGSSTCDEDTPAVLCSEKTSTRKRKRKQKRHGPKSKTSEYCGVILYKRTEKWEAHIWYQGRQIYLGASITKVHAAQVYDRAALFLFGPDADINFKPESYQEEYEFMQRLSHTQMVAYLRRESRQTGEEARYPGVVKDKVGGYTASYRPRKDKASHEPIGCYATEEEAVRAVVREAMTRGNYDMVERIFDVHHLRTVKPAPGISKQKRKAQKPKVVAATVLKKRSGRSRRSSGMANPAIQPEADAPPTQEVGCVSPKRQYNKKAKSSAAPLDSATESMLIDLPINQSSGRVARPRRTTGRKNYCRERVKENAFEKIAKEALRVREVSLPRTVMIDAEPRAGQIDRASRKRKSTIKSHSAPDAKNTASCSAQSSRPEQLEETEGVAEKLPRALSATLRVYLPRKSRSKATRVPRRTPALSEVFCTATLESFRETQVAAPTSPAASAETEDQSPPAVYASGSGSSTGPQIGSSLIPTQPGIQGQSSGTPSSFDCESSGAIPNGSGLPYVTYMELSMDRSSMQGSLDPTASSKSSGVIRPVARRLTLRTQMSDAGDGGQSWKDRLFNLDRDLLTAAKRFGPPPA